MANTIIQIKRSTETAIPVSLANGEFAITSNGDVLYIGSNGAVLAVGGRRVPGVLTANQALVTNSTGMLDTFKAGNSTVNAVINATHLTIANSTASISFVRPTAAQIVSADYYLASDSTWKQITAGAVAFDNLTDVTITDATNNDIAVYNGTTSQWVNKAVGNGFTFASQIISVLANNGIVSNTTGVWARAANGISVDASGINVLGNNGITANSTGVWARAANGISVDASGINVLGGPTLTINSTGAHVNSTLSITDLTLSGNLVISGTLVTVDATNMAVNDSIIELARNNGADAIDIGLFGQYNDGVERFTGLIYDTSADVYELFANTTVAPTTTLDTGAVGYVRATLRSYLNTGAFISNLTHVAITANSTVAVPIVANTLTLSTALAGSYGGTGLSSFTIEDMLVANSTNGFRKLSLGADGKVLQSNGSAVLYADLDGGTF